MFFADPPYNIDYNYVGYCDRRADYWEWCEKWLRECYRVLSDDGSIFVKQFSDNLLRFASLMKSIGFVEKNIIVWRNQSQANPQDRFLKEYEVIIFMTKTNDNYFDHFAMKNTRRKNGWGDDRKVFGRFGDLWNDIKRVTAGNNHHPEGIYKNGSGEKVHSCQMPQELTRRAILHTTKDGDVVLDFFNGVGTTTYEAKLHNRKFIDIEISDEYNKYAIQRLSQDTLLSMIGRQGLKSFVPNPVETAT